MYQDRWLLGCWLSILFVILFSPGCGSDDGSLPTASISPPGGTDAEPSLKGLGDPASIDADPSSLPTPQPRRNLHPEVVIETNLGGITVRLNAEYASETVDNFLESYVKRGFYDGTIFHYVEDGFITIAGGYTKDLQPKQARAPIRNEAHNGLRNKRGTIAMSRQADYIDSATSQFFFNLSDNSVLDHEPDGGDSAYGYCVFGEVVEGMDVLDRIAKTEVHNQGDFQNLPVEAVVITSVRILD